MFFKPFFKILYFELLLVITFFLIFQIDQKGNIISPINTKIEQIKFNSKSG